MPILKTKKHPLCSNYSKWKAGRTISKKKLLVSDWDASKNQLKDLTDETKLVNNYIKQVNAELFESYQKLNIENKLKHREMVENKTLNAKNRV